MVHELRIFICEDNEVTRMGLQMVLSKNAEFAVAGSATTGEALLTAAENDRIDVAIIDLHLAGALSGIDTVKRLRKLSPKTGVVILTGCNDVSMVRAAIRAGANAYCLKDSCGSRIAAAVLSAYRGTIWIDPRLTVSLVPVMGGREFSEDEIVMLDLWSQGLSVLEIARKLQSNINTVNSCAQRLFDKLQIQQRTETAMEAMLLQ